MTKDDAFNSNPMIGKIAYRLPSLVDLFGLPQTTFDQYWTMTFTVSVRFTDTSGEVNLACGTASNCQLVYKKDYTPTMYYL